MQQVLPLIYEALLFQNSSILLGNIPGQLRVYTTLVSQNKPKMFRCVDLSIEPDLMVWVDFLAGV